jgi:hypothetical protein
MPIDTKAAQFRPAGSTLAKVTSQLVNAVLPCFFYNMFIVRSVAEKRKAEYRNLLENTGSLQPVAAVLKGIHMDDGRTGFDAVLDALVTFDPARSWRAQECIFESAMKTSVAGVKIFLVRTVHILWMERNGQLPWSITNYTDNEIRGLFFELVVSTASGVLPEVPAESGWGSWWEDFSEPLVSLEASYRLHAVSGKLRAGTHGQTAVNCIRWIKSNFFHPYSWPGSSYGLDRYADGKPWGSEGGHCPRNISRLFEERIAGCHSPSVLLSEMLRLSNIPAFPIHIDCHGVVYIPSLDRFVHGDHLVNLPFYASEILLLTSAEVADYPNDPMLFDVVDAKLGTVIEPASTWRLTLMMHRDGSMLTFAYGDMDWVPSAKVLALLQKEVPQFRFRLNDAGTGLTSQPVPIRTLEDFSAPGSGLWH